MRRSRSEAACAGFRPPTRGGASRARSSRGRTKPEIQPRPPAAGGDLGWPFGPVASPREAGAGKERTPRERAPRGQGHRLGERGSSDSFPAPPRWRWACPVVTTGRRLFASPPVQAGPVSSAVPERDAGGPRRRLLLRWALLVPNLRAGGDPVGCRCQRAAPRGLRARRPRPRVSGRTCWLPPRPPSRCHLSGGRVVRPVDVGAAGRTGSSWASRPSRGCSAASAGSGAPSPGEDTGPAASGEPAAVSELNFLARF